MAARRGGVSDRIGPGCRNPSDTAGPAGSLSRATIERMWRLNTLAPQRWPELAAFIHAHNRRGDGRVRCLHAENGDSVQAQAAELRALPADEACFVTAHDEAGRLCGVAGAELDAGQRRAWVRGPLTDAGESATACRLALLQALHEALPQAQRFDAFPQVDEAPLRESLRRAGYRDHVQHHVMERDTTSPAPAWPAAVRDAAPGEAAALVPLHDALFPATYMSVAEMVARLDARHRLLVVPGADGAAPAGYLFVREQPHDREAYVDFLGVAPAARGRGLGRALLDAAVHWALVPRDLPRVHLTVREDRGPALGLYVSAGFREVAAGAQMIFERTPAANGP